MSQQDVSLLPIDEIGYIPIDRHGPDLFFQLISRRYEKGAAILTANRSFSQWNEIFGDPVIATDILGLILHHSTIINIKGNSYRLKVQGARTRSAITTQSLPDGSDRVTGRGRRSVPGLSISSAFRPNGQEI